MGGTCAARADLVLFQRSSVGVAPQGVTCHPMRMRRSSERVMSPFGQRDRKFTYRRCEWGFRRSKAVLVDRRGCRNRRVPGGASRERAAPGTVPMEGVLDRRRPRRLTARRTTAVIAGLIVERSGAIPQLYGKKREGERQRQDDDLRSRPTTPRGRSAARRAP
jgi:hypothetical protein